MKLLLFRTKNKPFHFIRKTKLKERKKASFLSFLFKENKE
nr:MAG TPA: hypothetical protein [Caudoviricetes sp.]